MYYLVNFDYTKVKFKMKVQEYVGVHVVLTLMDYVGVICLIIFHFSLLNSHKT
nr:odorant receptor [Semanotus bifasciatus]